MKHRGNLLLLALVAVCALSLYFGRSGRTDPPDSGPIDSGGGTVAGGTELTPVAPVRRVEQSASPVHLRVLNGTTESGLARRMGVALSLAGCVAEDVGNAPHDRFARSLLINRRLDRSRAEALARRLGGIPLLEEQDPRAAEDAVLVLGEDHERIGRALAGAGR